MVVVWFSHICEAAAQVPIAEREALIALYSATDGPQWTTSTNWLGAPGTECTWYGVTCTAEPRVRWLLLAFNNLTGVIPPEIGDFESLWGLDLAANFLAGGIPPEIGDLGNLRVLQLQRNKLAGTIPPEIGGLTNLRTLYLFDNSLEGALPPQIGNLSSLEYAFLFGNELGSEIPPEIAGLAQLINLDLARNRLDGSIPPEIGLLDSLLFLNLDDNQLVGNIPPEIESLGFLHSLRLKGNRLSGNIPQGIRNLVITSTLQLSYNGLWTDSPEVQAYLDSHQPGWDLSQTVAPSDLVVTAVGDRTVWLGWTPILYSGDHGGYEVLSEPSGSGVVSSGGLTSDKDVDTFPITGLEPGETYDVSVRTHTWPHASNGNAVTSDATDPLVVATTDLGCATPTVAITQGWPISLTVTSIHSGFEWSTGETSSVIEVRPRTEHSWYWVRTDGPAGCDEAAAVLVEVQPLFVDGFESGSTSSWSSSTGE